MLYAVRHLPPHERKTTHDSISDVVLEDSVNTFFSKVVAKFGRLDYCCNVAGILITGASPSLATADFDKQWSINARGMWLCQKAELTQMLKQEPIEHPESPYKSRGAIANVASMAALRGYDNLASYSSAKHAIIGFTKCDAYAYGKDLIRVNAVCPGVIATPLLGFVDPNDTTNIEAMTKDMSMGRQGQPEEIAEGMLWLCSSYASFVTGIALPINGGKLFQVRPCPFNTDEQQVWLEHDGKSWVSRRKAVVPLSSYISESISRRRWLRR